MRYIFIYRKLLEMNLARFLAYRASAITGITASMSWGALSLLTMILLTSKTQSVYGWAREELLLLAGLYGVVIGIFHMVFTKNFERFSLIVYRGDLDSMLLKPLDSQFALSLWQFSYFNIFRTVMAGGFSVYIINAAKIRIELINIIGFMALIGFGLLILYSIWFIALTITIWYPNLSNLIVLLYNISDSARFPPEMFTQFRNFLVFLILPLTLVIAPSLKLLLNKVLAGEVAGLVLISCSLFILSRLFWKFALRYYTSASG